MATGVPAATRVAAIYDIHGNLPALEAVLRQVDREGVDEIVVGGDVVPGPMSREAVEALLEVERPLTFISGNGEREVRAARAGADLGHLPERVHEVLRWVAGELSPDQVRLISEWPQTYRVDVAGLGGVLFCHATPRSDDEIFTSETPEDGLRPVFEAAGAPLVVCGHTHMQFDRSIGEVRVVNAGSVGMPFGAPGAYWLLLGPRVELCHTEYDLTRAAARIRATAYPQADDFAANYVMKPPSAEKMLGLFEGSQR